MTPCNPPGKSTPNMPQHLVRKPANPNLENHKIILSLTVNRHIWVDDVPEFPFGGRYVLQAIPWRHMSHISLPGPFTHSYRFKKWTGRRLIWTFLSRPKSSCHLFLGKRTLWDFVERAWNFSVTRGIILHFRYLNPLVLKTATSRPNPNSSWNKKVVKTSTSIGKSHK